MVATQDGGLELVWPGWPPGCCFPTASRARSQVIVPVEAWAGSELGESTWSEAATTCPFPTPPPLAPRKADSLLWGLQHCGHEWERGLPEKEASPPVSRVGSGET